MHAILCYTVSSFRIQYFYPLHDSGGLVTGRSNSTISVASFGRDYEYRSIATIYLLYIPTCFLELIMSE